MSLLSDLFFWGDLWCVCVAGMLYVQLRLMFVYIEVVGKGKANRFVLCLY